MRTRAAWIPLLAAALCVGAPSLAARAQRGGPACGSMTFTVPLRFDLYQGRADPTMRDTLDRVAERLRACPGQTFELQVHTDTVRMSSFNLRQSQAVAEHVRELLARRRVDMAQLAACGHGEQTPVIQDPRWDGSSPNERLVVRAIAGPARSYRCRP